MGNREQVNTEWSVLLGGRERGDFPRGILSRHSLQKSFNSESLQINYNINSFS